MSGPGREEKIFINLAAGLNTANQCVVAATFFRNHPANRTFFAAQALTNQESVHIEG